jgi:hypothetical protein
MELFIRLFAQYLRFTYSCFDRIVINGYLQCFFRESAVVYLFKEILGFEKITKEVLKHKTVAYNKWVEKFASDNQISCEWAEKDAFPFYPLLFLSIRSRCWRDVSASWFLFTLSDSVLPERTLHHRTRVDQARDRIQEKRECVFRFFLSLF